MIVQPLVPPGADMLVGTVNDPDLGSVIAVGLGGLQARLTETAAFRLPPATDTEADELIDSAKGVAAELNGLRGSAPLDREALRKPSCASPCCSHRSPRSSRPTSTPSGA